MKTRFDHAYVLNVMSDDHPGIVSAVTGAVDRLGGNIDAASQTVLAGYFTLIMVVSVPEPLEPDHLAEEVRRESASAGFTVTARPYDAALAEKRPAATDRFVLTAFGGDRAGIVRRFSQYLAGKDINIIDLYGERRGEDFVLIGQVEIPASLEIGLLQADLEQIALELDFTVKLQHENVFVATNQLRLTVAGGR